MNLREYLQDKRVLNNEPYNILKITFYVSLLLSAQFLSKVIFILNSYDSTTNITSLNQPNSFNQT